MCLTEKDREIAKPSDTMNNDQTVRNSVQQYHSLMHSWTFWFDNPHGKFRQAEWGMSLKSIHTFHTIEDFWGLYNNIVQPSKLPPGSDFHCFKFGIQPKWEDPVCASGGKWTININRGKAFLDTFWLYTVLAMIGDQFDESDLICGAVVSIRARQCKIALWTKDATNESSQVSIAKQWKELLDCYERVGYIFHEDARKLDKLAKNRYYI